MAAQVPAGGIPERVYLPPNLEVHCARLDIEVFRWRDHLGSEDRQMLDEMFPPIFTAEEFERWSLA